MTDLTVTPRIIDPQKSYDNVRFRVTSELDEDEIIIGVVVCSDDHRERVDQPVSISLRELNISKAELLALECRTIEAECLLEPDDDGWHVRHIEQIYPVSVIVGKAPKSRQKNRD